MELNDDGRKIGAERLHVLLGGAEGDVDAHGLELVRLVRIVAQQLENVADDPLRATDLSAPRFGLLMRLLREELEGRQPAGTSPTHLSHCQNVSKNTISVLLRGLEDKGLIERTLDPADRRAVRIRVSAAGRALVRETAPRHLAHLNRLLAALTPDEQAQLAHLLGKLHLSLLRTEGGS